MLRASQERLDQIWDTVDIADRTSLSILPAFMLRAHKESTGYHDTD